MNSIKVNKYKVALNEDLKLVDRATNPGKMRFNAKELEIHLAKTIKGISKLQNKLFAENRRSLLILFQGMDSSGKDSCIRSITAGLNPHGVTVTSFKHPTEIELEHDYLWRHAQRLPEHGQIAIFNRSHYENVLISRVHPRIVLSERLPGVNSIEKINGKFWKMRYQQINYFEEMNCQNGTTIIKFFLHLSKEEQCKRFISRLEHKEKHWKFSSTDIIERSYWEKYQRAYEQALKHTSTKHAPWYIIPADNKPLAHLLICKIILEKLRKLSLQFPPISAKEMEMMEIEKEKLLSEKDL